MAYDGLDDHPHTHHPVPGTRLRGGRGVHHGLALMWQPRYAYNKRVGLENRPFGDGAGSNVAFEMLRLGW